MNLPPAPLHRVLEALEDSPAPPERLDVEVVVRRGRRRRHVRRALAGSLVALALGTVGTGVALTRPADHLTPAATKDSVALARKAAVAQGAGGGMPRGGYAPVNRGEGVQLHSSNVPDSSVVASANGPADGALYDLRNVPRTSIQFQSGSQQSVISTSEVVLRSKAVDTARTQVLAVIADVGGQIADEQTTSDKSGDLASDQLVLRIPSSTFAGTVSRLGTIGTRVSSVTHAEDVTAKVIDTAARLRIQRASVGRIRQLLDRAQSIRDIVSIEGQLSQREATLESLEKQQKYLAGQTARATVTVSITRADVRPEKKPDAGSSRTHRHGFVGGLDTGWHRLTHAGARLAVLAGEALPWAVLLLVLAVPLLLLSRRMRRRWVASISGP